MKSFAQLIANVDQTNSTNEKVNYLVEYFKRHDPLTVAWAVHVLMGKQKKKIMTSASLRKIVNEQSGLPAWLMDECYSAVGDTAEMIALIVDSLPDRAPFDDPGLRDASLVTWMEEKIPSLARMDDAQKRTTVSGWWRALSRDDVFILNKLMTGALRIGLSDSLVIRALATHLSISKSQVAAGLISRWTPSAQFFENLARVDEGGEVSLIAAPFCLAAPLEQEPSELGPVDDWLIEWKWDGIRAQITKRGGEVEIWSRGEERITETFPDLASWFRAFGSDGAFDGEIVADDWRVPGPFQNLQNRLNKKAPGAAFVAAHPIGFIAYDCLNFDGQDLRGEPLATRRAALERALAGFKQNSVGISEAFVASSWDAVAAERAKARLRGAEGFMLKRKTSVYETGRKRGVWFKWKLDPLTLDVVLTAAQPGTGKRASLYTDYTFSIWKGEGLVPIAKAYSGLTDEEIRKLDNWIRRNTLERFGPVRTLKPEKVYEIGFEGVGPSARHKSGFAVRFPRVLRERVDKQPADANRVEDVAALVHVVNERMAQ